MRWQPAMAAIGYWKEPDGIPPGDLVWRSPEKSGLQTYTASVQTRLVALVRKSPYQPGCTVKIEGWLWTSFPEGSVDAKLGTKESPVRQFPNVREAKKAVAAAWALLQHPGI